jgi:4-amino-4-deoxy-L-arabinose transferase-like glycosyltransferase
MPLESKDLSHRTVILGLLAVLCLAAAIRVYLIATTVTVSRDSITFITYAKGLASDPVGEMRRQDQHPLYPAAILLVHTLAGRWLISDPVHGWQWSAQVAALLGGLVMVAGAYALGRTMWNPRVGLIAALFTGVLPDLCKVSADALSDGLHLGLYVCGLATIIRAQQMSRLRWLAAAAVFSGLAFLTRPEGGTILFVGLVVVVGSRKWIGWTWRQRVGGSGVMLVCFAVVAGPYMFTVGRLVRKKSLYELFRLGETAGAVFEREKDEREKGVRNEWHEDEGSGPRLVPVGTIESSPWRQPWVGWGIAHSEPRRGGKPSWCALPPLRGFGIVGDSFPRTHVLGYSRTPLTGLSGKRFLTPFSAADITGPPTLLLLYHWIHVCRLVYFLLALPALRIRSICRPHGLLPVALAAIVHAILLHALRSSFGYLGLRHVLVLAVLTLPLAAASFVWLVDVVSQRIESRGKPEKRLARPVINAIIALAVIGPTVPWILRPIGGGRGYIVSAGRWLREHSRPGDRVLTYDSRIAYYADRPMQMWLEGGSPERLTVILAQFRPAFFAIDEPSVPGPERNARLRAGVRALASRGRLTLVHEASYGVRRQTGTVLIYRVNQ